MTVNIVGKHHEGAGDPRTVDLSKHGYSYAIYENGKWENYRQPDDPRGPGYHDFSVLGYTAKVMGVVLTGDRNKHPVTDLDLQAMREIAAHARGKNWVVAQPNVWAHRQFPWPNATVCAGNNVGPSVPNKGLTGNNMKWLQIVGCYHLKAVPPMPSQTPEIWPGIDDVVSVCVFGANNQYIAMVTADGHLFCPKGGYQGGVYDDKTGQPKSYWKLPDGKIRGAAEVHKKGDYVQIIATTKEPYGPDF